MSGLAIDGDIIEELENEMERCRPWIQAALERGQNTHLFSDIVDSVKRGHMQFWPAEDACAVTEIIEYPRKKALHIFLAGGNMETIVDMNESAEHFARLNGCTIMSVAGRKGWQKILSGKGYKPYVTSLAKEI
jgi:hypothetical protein|tara:strand:- start:166 stop:564 length:399 start_codon:yes stop_codon:yes gene_type:complete